MSALHWIFTLAGGILEVGGLGLQIRDATVDPASGFDLPQWLRRVLAWRPWQQRVDATVHAGAASMTGSSHATSSAAGTLITDTSETERLSRELNELRQRVEQIDSTMLERFEVVETAAAQHRQETAKTINEVRQVQAQQRGRDLRIQVRGAILFMIGAACSTVANLV